MKLSDYDQGRYDAFKEAADFALKAAKYKYDSYKKAMEDFPDIELSPFDIKHELEEVALDCDYSAYMIKNPHPYATYDDEEDSC